MSQVTLTFNNITATIVSNDDGMFDLNDVWRDFDIRASKRPSQWRDGVKEHFASSANLQFIRGRHAKTLATLEALYAYAMWVDVKFYIAIVTAFSALTLGETKKAEQHANERTLDASRSLLNEPLRSFQLLGNTLVATDAEPILGSFLRAYRQR